MKKQLNKPSNWQDFEDLCKVLWQSIWCDPNTKKNGRAGQNQHGVDIYGIPFYEHKYEGVQCKGKNESSKNKLTKQELIAEAQKAVDFKPTINKFIIATTSQSDANIQSICRILNENKTFPFSLHVWSWDDISDEIQCRPNVYRFLYNEELGTDMIINEIHIGRLDGLDKIQQFLSREHIKQKMSTSVLLLLNKLLFELADNSFKHGMANVVSLKFDNNVLYFSDNGNKYKTNELSNSGHGGTETYKYFCSLFKTTELSLTYTYNNSNNILKFNFSPTSLLKNISATEIDVVCTTDAIHTVNQALEDIYPYVLKGQRVKLLVKDNFVLSSARSYLDSIFERFGNYIDSVCIPQTPLAKHLIDSCKKFNIRYIER